MFKVVKDARRDRFNIIGPKLCDNNINIEYADSNIEDVLIMSEKIANILSDNWDHIKYSRKKDSFVETLETEFKNIFDEIMSEESNGEKAEDVFVDIEDDKITLFFSVNGKDYGIHKDNEIIIKNGKVKNFYFSEFLDSRCGSHEITERLQGLLNNILK